MATRRERVVLSLEDDFSPKMLRAASSVALLNQELNRLSGQSVASARGTQAMTRDLDKSTQAAQKNERQIDRLSGRVRILADVAAMLGPAFAPLGGVALAGIAGLASQMGFAVAAAGVFAGSMQGVGDALKAVNKAALEPTAANIAEAQVALEAISPAAQEFVGRLHEMIPALKAVRDAGAGAMFPGFTDALDKLESLGPQAVNIFESIGAALGDIASDSAGSLSSDRWTPFLDFIAEEAPSALQDMARIAGDLTHGMAEMWMAFDPLNDGFSNWLVDVAAGFDKWATGLDQTEGFREFLDYIETTGPQVADTVGALANAMVQIAQAVAPLGGPVLQVLETLFNAIGAIADSDLGTPLFGAAAAMGALSRATAIWGSVSKTSAAQFITGQKTAQASIAATQTRLTALGRSATLGGVARGTALLGGLAIASTEAGDSLGVTNTASLALMGSIAGPIGAALGASAGAFMDAKGAIDNYRGAVEQLDDALLSGSVDQINAAIDAARQTIDNMSLYEKAIGQDGALADQIATAEAALERLSNMSIDPNAMGIAGLLGQPLGLAEEFEVATKSATDFKNSMLSLNDALAGRATWRDYEAAIDAVGEALQQNGKTLDITTEKGRANQQALDSIAGTSIKVAENLKGMDRVRFMQRARRDFIDAAQDLGKTREGARQLANDLGLIGTKKVKPKVDLDDGAFKGKAKDAAGWMRRFNGDKATPKADLDSGKFNSVLSQMMGDLVAADRFTATPNATLDASQAFSSANAIEARLNALNGKTATTYVRTVTTGGMGPQDALRNADGGTIPGKRYPYGDKMLSYLAPGEEVISNRYGQADRYRDVLKAINANRFADGGTAGGRRDDRRFPGVDTKAEWKALVKAAEKSLRAAEKMEASAEVEAEVAKTNVATAQQNYDATKALHDTFASNVAGVFSSGLTGGGLAGLDKTLTKDIKGRADMDAVLNGLIAAGLDTTGDRGALFAELAQSGDIKTANQLLAGGAGAIEHYEGLVAQRNAANTQAGSRFAGEAFGAQMQEQYVILQLQLDAAESANRRLEALVAASEASERYLQQAENGAERFADKINKTAAKSARNKKPRVGKR